MIRHWQHTSFCMGQCVSSCGSKRTLDSVPTTPDTENFPGLIPSTRSVDLRSKYNNSNYPSSEQILALSNKSPSRGSSPAAKFVTAFSQKKICTRRINPGSESPLLVSTRSPPSSLPLKITTLLTPVPLDQHGDMKGSPVKNYFRETISSAKKSSKTVTFSEETLPNTSNIDSQSRKKPFFLFGKSSRKGVTENERDSPARSFSRGFLLRKSNKNRSPAAPPPTSVVPVKEKQICRVTLSPKQGSSKQGRTGGAVTTTQEERQTSSSLPSCKLPRKTNGEASGNKVSECNNSNDQQQQTKQEDNQTMGNVNSTSQALVNEAVKKSKAVVKATSANLNLIKDAKTGDINENTTPYCTLTLSKSAEENGLAEKGKDEFIKKSQSDLLRNINVIKEENRQLRLKFFAEDSSSVIGAESPSPSCPSEITTTAKMNRQNLLASKSSIPLPRSTTTAAVAKSVNNASGLPKLYSVPTDHHHDHAPQKSTTGIASARSRIGSVDQQPTNLNNGKWVNAANFFESSTATDAARPQTSPAVSRSSRRLSEPPPKWTPRNVTNNKFPTKGPGAADQNVDSRRETTIGFQPRKLPGMGAAGIPRAVNAKPVTSSTSTKSTVSYKSTSSKIGVRKPEETKPFYTIGLYQNRPKPLEPPKTFGVLQTGFQGVSTGIVKQRTEQYQSKMSEGASVQKANDVDGGDKDENKNQMQGSPGKPGVVRSATYTIRKHPSVDPIKNEEANKAKSGSDVDPRFLTWTVRKGSRHHQQIRGFKVESTLNESFIQREDSISPESSGMSGIIDNHMGYPLQHDVSGASTSSMGTNEDGVGDHAPISDSEYLIDDEISDQPDLTLTFKDSSLVLSSSSSGESLLSCDIMLDHLDHHQDRILGELTSDSAISDISSHKPTSQSSSDRISKFADIKRSILEETSNIRSSPSETASPSSVRTVKHPKSPRRTTKIASTTATTPSNSRTIRHPSGDTTSIPRRLSGGSYKSPVSGSAVPVPSRTTPEKRTASTKPNHVRSIVNSTTTSLSPANQSQSRIASKSQVVGLTVENVSKLHKQFELAKSSENSTTSHEGSLPVPLVEELLSEFHGLKDKLEQLQIQLETQERREREKDELIQRLTEEVERRKSTVGEDSLIAPKLRNGSIIPIRPEESNSVVHKERCMNNLNYENAAVQTDNHNIFNRTITYPEEDDKYGELVSFRIGRSSSVKKKL